MRRRYLQFVAVFVTDLRGSRAMDLDGTTWFDQTIDINHILHVTNLSNVIH